MRREDEFEQHLADMLEEGPPGAPDGPMSAAIAHAHAHPRRRFDRYRPWRTVMSQFPVSDVRARQSRNRTLIPMLGIGAVAVFLVVAIAWGGILPRGGTPATVPGAAVGTASPAASAASPAAQAASPAASPDAAADAVRGGYAVTDLAGTWKGDILVPWYGANGESDPSKDTSWRLDMTIDMCGKGESCGLWSFATDNLEVTGKPASCDGTLTYRGFYEDRAAFQFAEAVSSSTGGRCQGVTLVITPLASGTRAGIEERSSGVWLSHGLVTRYVAP